MAGVNLKEIFLNSSNKDTFYLEKKVIKSIYLILILSLLSSCSPKVTLNVIKKLTATSVPLTTTSFSLTPEETQTPISLNSQPEVEEDIEETKKFSQVLSTEAFEYMKETEEVIYDGHNWVINPEKDEFKWSGDMHILVFDSATAETDYIKFAPNQTMVLFSKNNEILVFYGGDKDGYGQKIPIKRSGGYPRVIRAGDSDINFGDLQSKELLFLQGNDTINEAVLIEVIEWLRVFKKEHGFDGMDILLYIFDGIFLGSTYGIIEDNMTEEDIIQLAKGEIAEEAIE